MSSFYSSLSNEENMLPTSYLLNQKLDSYSNNKAYELQHSVSLSYSNLLNHGSEPIQNYHGLSLSLGSQEHASLDLNQYTDSSLYSLVSSDTIQLSEKTGVKNVQYISFDLAGKTQDNVKYENFNQNLINSQMTNFIPSLCQEMELTGIFSNSKYLKTAQDLLNEVVNVHKVPKQSGKNCRDFDEHVGVSTELHEPTSNAAHDLLPLERHDLQNKMIKLFSMLDEVDKKYRQYFHQMQVLVSSFDTLAGHGAAKSYTSLALQTISRQFRCLRDALKKQIQDTQKILGEQDSNSLSQNVLSRLRYVDQQLRQQKAFQQFGIMTQPWRPQRGLPEMAVSVLRSWLFEHFLHPYPKHSEKIVLARQTGLNRSQIANWFINARVRLWKPMIEDMYKDEFGNSETEPKSSPENATTTQYFSVFDEREDEFHVNFQREELGGYETGDFSR